MIKFDKEYVNKEEIIEFNILHDISEKLTSSLNLKITLRKIFKYLDQKIGLDAWLLLLLDPFENEVLIEKQYGKFEDPKKEKSLNKWKEIAKNSLNEEKTYIIPHIDQEVEVIGTHDFSGLGDESFICIPIIIGEQKIGAMCVNCPFKSDEMLHRMVKLLLVIALMIGQEIRLKQLMEKEKDVLKGENVQLKSELKEKYNIHNMIGKSSKMHEVFSSIQQVAHSNATVLIRGESGTGKELVAHAIHYLSKCAKGPFIRVNCGAIPENLIVTELFGHEKGAFTDAIETRRGKFELAAGGTIFLDEIGELSLLMQVKLLHVLQEKKFHRVGGEKDIKADVRVITATNRNLEEEITKGLFREDLYYRLNVFPIFLPPLRDRKADILLLVDHFIEKYGSENNKVINKIHTQAVELLINYEWPGNVRELQNAMERAVILSKDEEILPENLPVSLQSEEKSKEINMNGTLSEMIDAFQKEIIIKNLKETKGNISKSAKKLKTTMRVLNYKINQLSINYKEYRQSE